eukprot:4113808-Heterocapsa_arctica.AAC.1
MSPSNRPVTRLPCSHQPSASTASTPPWPKEEGLYTPSQGPPPIQIHENNQAFAWVQKTLAAEPPPEGLDPNLTLPSGVVAGAIVDDWGVRASGQ